MTNPTTPFSWQMPTSTDLVTDLPADFETFGQAVATSMADLLGGTTGQVLAKASNTDMDFSWVAQDDSNAIQNAIVDAKGDLIAASAADTPARLAVGNNGEGLVADSSTSTGLRYQGSISAGRNFVTNGGMDVWQRGASGFGTSTGTYTADRWVLGSSSTTVTRDTDVPTSPYFNYSLKMVGTGDNSLIQRVESANSTLLAGQTVTFTFYAKRTSGTGALDVRFYYPSAVDNFASITQIGSTVVVSASPSSSWTRYSVTAAIGTNITAGLQILINNTGAATTFITGAQLELGSVATNFSRIGGSIAGELAACQRYYQLAIQGSNFVISNAGYYNANLSLGAINLGITMRTTPSLFVATGTNYYQIATNNGLNTFNSFSLDSSSQYAVNLFETSTTGTSGAFGQYRTANANSSIALSAEL